MKSTARVLSYIKRQKQAGRKAAVLYLLPATIAQLKTLAGNKQRGEIVDTAISQYVINNAIEGDQCQAASTQAG